MGGVPNVSKTNCDEPIKVFPFEEKKKKTLGPFPNQLIEITMYKCLQENR
jgi:hypothetical protein